VATLSIFKEAFVLRLRTDIGVNLAHYTEAKSWLAAEPDLQQWEIPSSLELKEPVELVMPTEADFHDIENAIRIHRALVTLTPLQARDPRLWTRLAHVELWGYMRLRWPAERHAGNADKEVRFIDSRYFVSQAQGRALLRHGIARLWWAGHVSYDKDRDNPYELTRVLLSNLDVTLQLLERSLGRSPAVAKGFLEFLLKHEAELLAGGDANRMRIRHLLKFLNMQGGVLLLDCLSPAEISTILDTELATLQAA